MEIQNVTGMVTFKLSSTSKVYEHLFFVLAKFSFYTNGQIRERSSARNIYSSITACFLMIGQDISYF